MRCVVGIAFVDSISRLSVPFSSLVFGFFWFAAGDEGAYLRFVEG